MQQALWPREKMARLQHTSTVGFPRESITCLAFTAVMLEAWRCCGATPRAAVGAFRRNVRAIACIFPFTACNDASPNGSKKTPSAPPSHLASLRGFFTRTDDECTKVWLKTNRNLGPPSRFLLRSYYLEVVHRNSSRFLT